MASFAIRLVSIALVVNKSKKIEREESYFIRTTRAFQPMPLSLQVQVLKETISV